MNPNTKIKSLIKKQKLSFVFSLLLITLLSSISYAQSNSDFQGTWTGTDSKGNSIEVNLNANYTAVFKINGTSSYNITHYRLTNESETNNPAKSNIRFYTNINSAPTSGTVGLPATNAAMPANKILKGNLELSGKSNEVLILSFTPDGSKAAVSYSLHK